jgi:choline dehydrogenase-like flavoprotein
MIFDFNEAWTRVSESNYDVCVCGTGPAGITVARKLATHGRKVLLLEGGGLEYSDQSQHLYDGKSIGRQYWFVESGRLRYFGGTSNHWSGRCSVFDPIDFEAREYFRMPGWPISYDQVIKGMEEAQEIVDIGGKDLSPYDDPRFASRLFRQSGFALSPPTRFAEKYDAEIRGSERIDLFYDANLTDLKLSDDLSRVRSLVVENFNGQKLNVSAPRYVVALGAIENARILLNANRQMPEGIGNGKGWVGRCFMEHLNVPIGRFIVTDTQFWQKETSLVPTAEFLRQSNIGNGIVSFGPNSSPQSYGRLRVLKQFARETGCALPRMAEVMRQVVDFDCPGDGLVTSLIEQSPNPDSRVSLINDTDKFGLRRIQLNWSVNERDKKTIRLLAIKTAEEMARLDLARVQLAPFITNPNLDIEVGAHAHHMGTTRMATTPDFGVVNENCQVFGVDNLYIAGSSIFPTGGGCNPTLTIVKLALRLAEFLASRD